MSLKQFVNDKGSWDEFCDYLDKQIDAIHKSMESISDTTELYRLQGSILALRKLKYMRDYLNG